MCGDCPAANLWQRIPVRAALMLHSDCAQRARRDRLPPRLHESVAVEIARMLKDDPAHRAFVRRWYEAMAGLAQGENRWGEALDWAERGLRDFPDSAEMLLVLGSIEETVGAQAALSLSRRRSLVDPSTSARPRPTSTPPARGPRASRDGPPRRCARRSRPTRPSPRRDCAWAGLPGGSARRPRPARRSRRSSPASRSPRRRFWRISSSVAWTRTPVGSPTRPGPTKRLSPSIHARSPRASRSATSSCGSAMQARPAARWRRPLASLVVARSRTRSGCIPGGRPWAPRSGSRRCGGRPRRDRPRPGPRRGGCLPGPGAPDLRRGRRGRVPGRVRDRRQPARRGSHRFRLRAPRQRGAPGGRARRGGVAASHHLPRPRHERQRGGREAPPPSGRRAGAARRVAGRRRGLPGDLRPGGQGTRAADERPASPRARRGAGSCPGAPPPSTTPSTPAPCSLRAAGDPSSWCSPTARTT